MLREPEGRVKGTVSVNHLCVLGLCDSMVRHGGVDMAESYAPELC